MISWLRFRAHDDETDWIARESYFQAGRLLQNADRTDVVELSSDLHERLFVLPTTMALQRAGEDQHGFMQHDLLITGHETSDMARMVMSGIPGYQKHWQHMQSGYHELTGDLDARIGYARAILDHTVPFWKQ